MKRETSSLTNLTTDVISANFSPRTLKRPMSCKNYSRSNYKTSDINNVHPIYSCSNNISTEHSLNCKIENEHLHEMIYQIKSQICYLKKELIKVQKENIEKDKAIYHKDKEINTLINNNTNIQNAFENESQQSSPSSTTNNSSTLLSQIKQRLHSMKKEIEDVNTHNHLLKKHFKYTKCNEYTIEDNIMHLHMKQLEALYANSIDVHNQLKVKLNEFDLLEENITKQKKLLTGLNSDLVNAKQHEKALMNDYAEIKNKIERNNTVLNNNQYKVKVCQKEQERLKNDTVVYGYDVDTVNESDYKKQIAFYTKEVNEYKLKLKRNENMLKKVKERNRKLEEMLAMDEKKRKVNDVIVTDKEGNTNTHKEESEEDVVNRLQKQIEKSKEIEEQLDEQLRVYMSKVEELAEEGEFNKGNENDNDNEENGNDDDNNNNNNVNEDDIVESYKGSDNVIGNNEMEY